MDWLRTLFDIQKVPSRIFAVVALGTGILLFLPLSARNVLHLIQMPVQYGWYLGLGFVISGCFLAVNSVTWLLGRCNSALKKKRSRLRIAQHIEDLDQAEKYVLREYVLQGKHSIELPINHPTVAALITKGILKQASPLGYQNRVGMVFPVIRTKVAQELLTWAVVDLPDNPSQQELAQIRSERPNFIAVIEGHDEWRGGY